MGKKGILKIIDKIDIFLIKSIRMICALFLVVMLISVTISVTTRFVFFSPINWADALTKYLMIWLAFLGSGLALREREHIGVTLLTDKFTGKRKKILKLFTDFVISLFLLLIVIYGLKFSLDGLTSIDPLVFEVKMIYPYLAVPIGSLYGLIHLNIGTIKTILTWKEN